jgi:phage/plasmid-associated DNA primase
VLEATEQYFAEQDVLKQWLDECTEDGGPMALTRTRDLFTSWKTWTEERNLKPGSEKSFSEMLTNNYAKKRNNAGQWSFVCLTLKAR